MKVNTARGEKKTYRRVVRSHDENNQIAAEVILASPANHSEIQIEWARLFLQRRGLKPRSRSGADLFGEARR